MEIATEINPPIRDVITWHFTFEIRQCKTSQILDCKSHQSHRYKREISVCHNQNGHLNDILKITDSVKNFLEMSKVALQH